MRKSKIITLTFITLTLLFLVLIFLSPMAFVEQFNLAQLLTITLLLTGGAVLLWTHLKYFQQQLRHAYALICVSLLLVVSGAWQFVVIGITGAMNSPWVVSGGAELPFFVANVLLYAGVRILTRLVGVKNILLNPLVTGAIALGVGASTVVGMMLIGAQAPVGQYILSVTQGALALCAAMLLYKARMVTSTSYHPALTWLMWYCIVIVVAGIQTLATLGLPDDHWYITHNIGNLLFVFNGIFIMLSAYGFARVATAEKVTHMPKKNTGQRERSVDVVVFLAGLASQPTAIDPFMDPIRVMTASLDSTAPLTADQQAEVADVYAKIEQYLVTKEPVRAYRKEDLRQMVDLRFKDSVDEPAFWQKVANGRNTQTQ